MSGAWTEEANDRRSSDDVDRPGREMEHRGRRSQGPHRQRGGRGARVRLAHDQRHRGRLRRQRPGRPYPTASPKSVPSAWTRPPCARRFGPWRRHIRDLDRRRPNAANSSTRCPAGAARTSRSTGSVRGVGSGGTPSPTPPWICPFSYRRSSTPSAAATQVADKFHVIKLANASGWTRPGVESRTRRSGTVAQGRSPLPGPSAAHDGRGRLGELGPREDPRTAPGRRSPGDVATLPGRPKRPSVSSTATRIQTLALEWVDASRSTT